MALALFTVANTVQLVTGCTAGGSVRCHGAVTAPAHCHCMLSLTRPLQFHPAQGLLFSRPQPATRYWGLTLKPGLPARQGAIRRRFVTEVSLPMDIRPLP